MFEKPSILIVDNTPANLISLRRMLSPMDINIIEATNGKDALKVMQENAFALVLLDTQMPDMDGYEVAKLMRSNQLTQDTPIIFITDNAAEDISELKAYDAGAIDYIIKPINSTILRSKVRIFVELFETKLNLIETKKQAEKSNYTKSSFLANMSHEIRTPLNGVIGMIRFLLDGTLNSKKQYYAETALNSAEELLQLINDILDFSKIESGKMDLEPVSFDFLELAEDVAEVLALKARENGVELGIRYSPDTPRFVIGDSIRVRQILYNLVGNAVKFTKEGHILIDIENEKDRNNKIIFKVAVEDTGIGIPKDKQSYLFTKFYQTDASTTRKFGGTGLGLAISKQLSEMMGGDIRLESELGKGTTFHFSIKLEQDNDKKETELFNKINLRGLKLLIVDDSITTRKIAGEKAKSLGVDADTVDSAKQALIELENAVNAKRPYDIALIDYLMPDIDGCELAKIINGNINYRKTKLIMMTALPKDDYNKKFSEAGFVGYLTKPLRNDILAQILQVLWNNSDKVANDGIITQHMLKNDNHTDYYQQDIAFNSANVLLVEDNIVNQAVAKKILQDLGCIVTTANNGIEAVAKAKNGIFDIIFMDCQMPEMDGFEATSIIRKLMCQGDIPMRSIVAFTANALKGDKEKCLKAGMDDYISKPIKPEDLKKIMHRWLPKDKRYLVSITKHKPEIDVKALNALHELMDENFIDTLRNYLTTAENLLNDIADSINSDNNIRLALAAHPLKSSSRQVGATTLAEYAEELEILGNNRKAKVAKELYKKARSEFNSISVYFNNELFHNVA